MTYRTPTEVKQAIAKIEKKLAKVLREPAAYAYGDWQAYYEGEIAALECELHHMEHTDSLIWGEY